MAYGATFDVQPPQQFDKAQVALRMLVIFVLSVFQIANIVLGGAYLAFPVLAAILISQKGAERYLAEAEEGPTRWLRYLMGFYSYMALASDRLPFERPEEVVQLRVQPSGSPTVGSALLRLILAIPHAIVLSLLGIIFAIVWIIAAVSILINETSPKWASSYIRGYLRWNARVFAYLASLVEEYPPFSFDAGPSAELPPTEPPAGGAGPAEQADSPPPERNS